MKKLIKMAILIGALASVLTSCNVKLGIESRKKSNEYGDFSETISIDSVDNIDIFISVGNIIINEIEGDEVTVDVTGKSDLNIRTIVEKQNNTIVIKEKDYKSKFKLGISSFEDRKVEIGIPSSYIDKLSLGYGVGDVLVKGINISELDIKGGAGNLDIKNIVFKSLQLEQGVGETDIDLKEKSGDIKIDGGVGSISLKIEEVGGDLKYEGGIGEADIYIPDKSPVKIKTSSGLGEININTTTSGENKYEFDLKVGVGSLSVN